MVGGHATGERDSSMILRPALSSMCGRAMVRRGAGQSDSPGQEPAGPRHHTEHPGIARQSDRIGVR